ncbi:GNAT family N-acetyltransferase [Chimaeribacter arupi]|uniref:GNAT family N-acetyltransferase n=2 Tax=Chimaeribacter arupi TaxID=2060066 RepID=UPI002944C0FA|nr:GNAT family protein [Chimaeribacter arupi]MDV5140945.1 GNAT family protein [Chimaeribacter arupi]
MQISEFSSGLTLPSASVRLLPPSLARVDEAFAALASVPKPHFSFLPWALGTFTPEGVREDMQQAIDHFEQDSEEYRFLIVPRHGDGLLGCIGLQIRNPALPFYELGYWLVPEATGHGYASQAVEVLTAFAFARLKARRLEIRMSGRNVKSRQVAERSGFRHEATLQQERMNPDGCPDDTLIYALLRPAPNATVSARRSAN